MFTAVLRVTGAGRLEEFRERLRWLMVRDQEAEEYSEHHAEGVLEYRFTPRKGIPFPAFAEASRDFPELRVEARWQHGTARGRAVIENGTLVEQAPEQSEAAAVEALDVEAAEDGRLVLALACRRSGDAWIGYAATADRHTYFRYREGTLELIDPETPEDALEEVAFAFVEEWLWYDEEEAPLERSRYADYGFAVRGANLRSEKLAALRRSDGRHDTLDAQARAASEALRRQWLNQA